MSFDPEVLADALRSRLLRGIRAGVLRAGDRLPSARELERDFATDHRVVLAAYRQLAAEGLVTMRERGGIYVAKSRPLFTPPEAWLIDVLDEGLGRDVPLPDLHEWLRLSVCTVRLDGVVIAPTTDQVEGLARELQRDYGIASARVHLEQLDENPLSGAIRHAHLIVTVAAYREEVQAFASRVGKPCIVATVRADLIGAEWRLLLQRDVYVVVHDREFATTVHAFFADVPGAENLRLLVAGDDDLAAIPDDAPTYITWAARSALGSTPLPGQPLPPARIFSPESRRELISLVVRANLDALAAIRRS